MIRIKNGNISFSMKEDGTGVAIEDIRRKTTWLLDESTRLGSRSVPRFSDDGEYSSGSTAKENPKIVRIGKAKTEKYGNTVIATHKTKAGSVTLRWVVESDRVRVTGEEMEDKCFTSFSLPGTFRPAKNEGFLSAIPLSQGIVHTGKGPSFCKSLVIGGHNTLTMSMFGQFTTKGAIIAVAETENDATFIWEKTEEGGLNLFWLQHPSMGKFSYPRETVMLFSDPGVTPVCKTYRKYEIEKGRFKTWEEKVSEKPVLRKLFGSAIVYMGYHRDRELDYAACIRKLKASGIDSAYVYPVLMKTTQPFVFTTSMGTIGSIDIRKHLSLLHKTGYMAGSFILITEGPDKNGNKGLKTTADGKLITHWKMQGKTWYGYSLHNRLDTAKKMIDREHKGFEGVHYDVLCSRHLEEDYTPGNTTNATDDFLNRKEIMLFTNSRNMLVSAEGFRDRLTPYYDLGNSKIAHVTGRDEYYTVPMTMLVYHDCAYQTWWEVDNYNNPEHRTQHNRGYQRSFYNGGGFARLQSAMDALYGTPPDIFPFGLQYNFVPHNHPEIYFYRMRLEDEAVKEAVEYAKPVMKLNKRVGMLEMKELKIHRPDGSVQESVFGDGTRVIANFANVALEAPGAGLLQPESWVVK
jgi:hypothetical protein